MPPPPRPCSTSRCCQLLLGPVTSGVGSGGSQGFCPVEKGLASLLQHLSVWTAVWVPLRLALLEVMLIMSVGESTGIRAQVLAVSSPAGFLHEPGHIAVLP